MPNVTKQDFVKFFDSWHTMIAEPIWRFMVLGDCCEDCEFKDESISIEDRIKSFWQKLPMYRRMDFMKSHQDIQSKFMFDMADDLKKLEEKEAPPKYEDN